MEQEDMANREHIQPEPHERDRYWGEYFIPKMDNTKIGREADDDHYHISPALISLVPQGTIFQGMKTKDPAVHVTSFLNLCDTSKPAGLTQDHMRKMLFPFSLRGHALRWYTAAGCANLDTFSDVVMQFYEKYYPPSKIEKLRNAVANF